MHLKRILFLILCLFCITIQSQIVPGEWREHMPYHNGKKLVIAGSKVYCMTPNSLFYYDKSDNSINKLSKIQGLSECEFSNIAYSDKSQTLIIVYSNSNIDIVKNNKILNLPYIKNKLAIADKRVHDITIVENLAYLSCSFGITILDFDKIEIKDTYYPSKTGEPNRVNDVCFDDKYIYAATQNGIFKALKNDPYLVNYSHWEQYNNFSNYDKECSGIEVKNSSLYVLYNNADPSLTDSITYFNNGSWKTFYNFSTNIFSLSLYNNNLLFAGDWAIYKINDNNTANVFFGILNAQYGLVDETETLWIADNSKALVFKPKNGELQEVTPNSPAHISIAKMDAKKGALWTVSGSRDDIYGSLWLNGGAESFVDNKWTHYGYEYFTDFLNMRDLIDVKINPVDPEKVYMTSWTNGGLVEYNHGSFKLFNASNSTLENFGLISQVRASGLSFDKKGDLWISASNVENPLSVYKPNSKIESDQWKSFSLGRTAQNAAIGGLVATSWGHKWVVMGMSTRIFIFNDNGTNSNTSNTSNTSDDYEPVEITLASVKSTTAPTYIYCITEDLKQNIWMGTDAGPVFFSSPLDPYNTDYPISGSKVLVPVVPGEEKAAYVLETERINAIAVDGNNRKWMATQNSGAFLFSEDGATQLYNFTTENSPLFSNTILDIAIDGKSGEVFFATDKGLISYRGFATDGGNEFGKVYAYPNPVRPDYNGNIIITGLLTDANVRITDISGNLVCETNALGGQAVWNGRNLLNKRVNTGVYLIFCSNKDGSKTAVSKLLFIH
jgi:hypothetical protein